ncbi:MAG TPA: hypothetical protein VK570_05560 [Rubrivivax sp.]|nr:hypothetical protein [Rubrivivax sp.]
MLLLVPFQLRPARPLPLPLPVPPLPLPLRMSLPLSLLLTAAWARLMAHATAQAAAVPPVLPGRAGPHVLASKCA